MKTILVPVGLTDDSTNAARYAMQLADTLGCTHIVLYHVFGLPVTPNPDPMGTYTGPMPLFDFEDYKKISEDGLQRIKGELQKTSTSITIETVSEVGSLTGFEINELAEKTGASFIVMGISSGDAIDETLIGSNAAHVAKNATLPLIAVPANVSFKPFAKIALACDLKKVAETVPDAAIKKILDTTKAQFFVLHVGEEKESLAEENRTLHQLFDAYQPTYHFVNNPDFTAAINDFATENDIDLIITIPKTHGWFEGLFRHNRVNALAFHSRIPLLMVHG